MPSKYLTPDHLRKKAKPQPRRRCLTPLEYEVCAVLTYFQAQVLRDAFIEQLNTKSGAESDEALAARVGVSLDLLRKFRRCRYKALVRPEVSTREVVYFTTNGYKRMGGPDAYEPPIPAAVKRRLPVRPGDVPSEGRWEPLFS